MTLSDYPEDGVVDLYAIWSGNPYTITFHANNGTQETITQKLTYGISTALSANTFKNEGKHFIGWSYYADGKINYVDKAVVSNLASQENEKVDLYALWEDNVYNVTFDVNGGQLNGTGYQTVKHNECIQIPEEPIRQGYTFKGWKNKATNTIYDFDTPVINTLVLEAVWEKNTYNIIFDANGGMGDMESLILSYDSNVSLPTNEFKRDHYVFAGWALSQNETVIYNDQEVIKNLTNQNNDTIVLYAQWTATSYQLSYQLNGGNAVSNPANYTIESATITLKNPVKTGYTFAGWYSDSAYRNKITQITKGSTGNKTFYAKWTKVAKPAKVKLKSLKNNAKNAISVSYATNKNVSGYQIAYSTSSKFTKSTTKYTTNKNIKNLKKGKTYYVKVRSYSKDSTGAKIYGSYS